MAPMRIQKMGAVTVGAWMMRDAVGGMLGTSGMWVRSRAAGMIDWMHARMVGVYQDGIRRGRDMAFWR